LPSEALVHICRDKFPADILDEARQMIEQYDLLTDDRPDLMLVTGEQLVDREQAKWLMPLREQAKSLTPPKPQKKLSPRRATREVVAINNNKPEATP
jgi:putative SOS response-associated peptidase YedK